MIDFPPASSIPPLTFQDEGTWVYGPGTREIVLPPGITYVTDTIDIRNRAGLTIRGNGRMQSSLIWRGGLTADGKKKPVFTSSASKNLVLKDFTLSFDTDALAAIVVTNAGCTGPYISTENEFRNILINSARTSGKLQYGIVIDAEAYGGNGCNSEHHIIEGCTINGCTKAGIAILSSQAHRCKIRNNQVFDCGIGFWLAQASQTVEDNFGGYCGTWLYAGQCFAGALVFDRNNAECCCRFAVCSPSSGSEIYLIRANRCDGMKPQPITSINDAWQYGTHIAGCVEFKNNVFSSDTVNPPSFIFTHSVENHEIVGNCMSMTVPPVINRIHGPVFPWGAWRNSWQRPDGTREAIPALDVSAGTTPQQPPGTPWPGGEPYPDTGAWLAAWRLATQ